jgi:hypothetical protein
MYSSSSLNSKKVYDKVCKTPGCDACGIDSGLGWLNPVSHLYISSSKKNESHDLRLLYVMRDNIKYLINKYNLTENTVLELEKIVNKIVYGVGIDDVNEKVSAWSQLSETFDFTKEDRIPDLIFSEVIWKAVKGENSQMPAPRRSAFLKVADKDDEK